MFRIVAAPRVLPCWPVSVVGVLHAGDGIVLFADHAAAANDKGLVVRLDDRQKLFLAPGGTAVAIAGIGGATDGVTDVNLLTSVQDLLETTGAADVAEVATAVLPLFDDVAPFIRAHGERVGQTDDNLVALAVALVAGFGRHGQDAFLVILTADGRTTSAAYPRQGWASLLPASTSTSSLPSTTRRTSPPTPNSTGWTPASPRRTRQRRTWSPARGVSCG